MPGVRDVSLVLRPPMRTPRLNVRTLSASAPPRSIPAPDDLLQWHFLGGTLASMTFGRIITGRRID